MPWMLSVVVTGPRMQVVECMVDDLCSDRQAQDGFS